MVKRLGKLTALISAAAVALGITAPVCAESDVEMAQYYADLGTAAEESGDYVTAGEYFEQSVAYGRRAGRQDYVDTYESRTMYYKPQLDLYTLSPGIEKTYGEMNEPNGVLYGDISENINTKESMCVIYCDWDWPVVGYVDRTLEKAEKYNQAIELAYNFNDVDEMQKETETFRITKMLEKIVNNHSTVPIYFRIAAEMNLWCTADRAEDYKAAFRLISDHVRANTKNAVVVWSASHVSSWGVTFRNYYPGDNYVDWVGVSVYANKYFNGNDLPTDCKWYFAIGNFADPELSVRAAIKAYGGRKPILITESGVARYTRGAMNEEHEAWAATRLRKLLAYIPMLYPEVKGIVYFNRYMDNELSLFDLGTAELKSVYNEFTQMPWFIQNSRSNSAQTFKKCAETITFDGDSAELYAYTHIFGDGEPRVDYYIDDTFIASATKIPYKVKFNTAAYKEGVHRLRVVMTGANGVTLTKEYNLEASNG